MLSQVPLDAALEGDGTRRATDTGPEEPHRHLSIRSNLDEFDIASVILNRRPNEIEDRANPLPELRRCELGRGPLDPLRKPGSVGVGGLALTDDLERMARASHGAGRAGKAFAAGRAGLPDT
jgi:hypothetical protein